MRSAEYVPASSDSEEKKETMKRYASSAGYCKRGNTSGQVASENITREELGVRKRIELRSDRGRIKTRVLT